MAERAEKAFIPMENEMPESELFELCRPYPVVSLVGLSKTAGRARTAVLNALVRAYYEKSKTQELKPLALTSVGGGTSGELRVYCGMYIATAAGVLTEADFTKKILHATGMNTPLGEVVITEALTDGRAVLAGPSTNSQLKSLCGYMLNVLGAGQVFVDGAGERRTFAVSLGGVILCAGDSAPAADECAHFRRLMSLPKVPNDGAYTDIQGALTDKVLAELTEGGKNTKLAVSDASKIFLSPPALDRFISGGGNIYVKNTANLIAVVKAPFAHRGTGDTEKTNEPPVKQTT